MHRRMFLLTLGGGAFACAEDDAAGTGGAGGASASTATGGINASAANGSTGASDAGGSTSTGAEPAAWSVPPLQLFLGEAAAQLADTLPAEARPGGVFGLHATSAPLPSGVSLSEGGALSVGAAAEGTTEGVVFFYEEPP